MSKTFFFKIVTDPDVDPRKCLVGLICAAQALKDGHQVDVFFASHAVRLLQGAYLTRLDALAGVSAGLSRESFDKLVASGARLHCSTGSQALLGVTPQNAEGVLIEGTSLHWSDPAGLIALCAAADVHLVY